MPTPKFPDYKKNSLRPNPKTADPSRGDLSFAQEETSVGHFGGWDAHANVVNGLPPEGPARPGGLGQPPNVPEVVKPYKNTRAPKK